MAYMSLYEDADYVISVIDDAEYNLDCLYYAQQLIEVMSDPASILDNIGVNQELDEKSFIESCLDIYETFRKDVVFNFSIKDSFIISKLNNSILILGENNARVA